MELAVFVFAAVEAIDDLVDTDFCVKGVRILNFVILLDLTLNDLPPPIESTAEAPSIMEISSLVTERYYACSSLVVGVKVNSRLLYKYKIPHCPILTYASFYVLRLISIND